MEKILIKREKRKLFRVTLVGKRAAYTRKILRTFAVLTSHMTVKSDRFTRSVCVRVFRSVQMFTLYFT